MEHRRAATVDPPALQMFYEPIVLEEALSSACPPSRSGSDDAPPTPTDSLLVPMQVFQRFVNKLAQVCDNRRGGTTVTAFTVLQDFGGFDGPVFMFGSNQRSPQEMAIAQDFVERLLHLVGTNPDKLQLRALKKKALWEILTFNVLRVEAYLDRLGQHLHECVMDCRRRQSTQNGAELEGLEYQLESLRRKADFPRDIMSGENQRQQFLSNCESLIKAIHSKDGAFNEALVRHSKEGESTSREPWCELRHYLGRMLSYRQAAEAIVAAFERWPLLFEDFHVVGIPSSSRAKTPLDNPLLTADEIIRNMCGPEEDPSIYREEAQAMQNVKLDQLIQRKISVRTFRPIVHAEMLVHGELLRHGVSHPQQYWQRWKYIGSSKPTCRLCHYYFNAHMDNVQVRRSHSNLYRSWRLPDVNKQGKPTNREQRLILARITDNVRDDAKRILLEKSSAGRRHDSNTHSTFPETLGTYPSDFLSSRGSAVSLAPESHTDCTELPGSDVEEDGNNAQDSSLSDESDQEDGGACIFGA